MTLSEMYVQYVETSCQSIIRIQQCCGTITIWNRDLSQSLAGFSYQINPSNLVLLSKASPSNQSSIHTYIYCIQLITHPIIHPSNQSSSINPSFHLSIHPSIQQPIIHTSNQSSVHLSIYERWYCTTSCWNSMKVKSILVW